MKKLILCLVILLPQFHNSNANQSVISISATLNITEKEDKLYQTPKEFQIQYDDAKLPEGIVEDASYISVYHLNDDLFVRMSNTVLDAGNNIASFKS
ncbi:MAG: hypothetical protein P9X24_11005 [Candidatus Hatepunaea meridiana]|nr:hypothetical protein [Candidatus Hatepunaea meridiana]